MVVKEAVSKNGDSTSSFPPDGSSTTPVPSAPSWADRAGGGARPAIRLGAPGSNQSSGYQAAPDKVLLVLDSIGSNMHMEEIEKITKRKVVTKKAYCTLPGAIFPNSDYTTVVPESLQANPDTKVLGFNASASDLTNISPGATREYCKQQASLSSSNTVKLASNALLSNHPSLELVIIPECAPRYDNLEWLNEYSNSELHIAKAELPSHIRDTT